jgi:hypothetical protein
VYITRQERDREVKFRFVFFFFILFVTLSSDDNGSSLSDVSTLDDHFSRIQFEFSSSEEEAVNDSVNL